MTTSPSAMVSARIPFDAGPRLFGQRCRIEQAAVAMNRREAVPEFVRQAGGQLAEPRQRFLQTQLLFELDDRGQVGEQADRGLQGAIAAGNRRHRDAEVPRAARRRA